MILQIDDKCRQEFNNLKMNKTSAYVIYKIENERIEVDIVGGKNDTWSDFLSKLPDKEYRYCVFDFKFTNHDGMHLEKLTFVNWNPDGTALKKKVLYATSKENFRSYLQMHTKEITLNSRQQMTEQQIHKELSK